MSLEIDFEPIGRRVVCAKGETILEAAQRAGIMLTTICGGAGSCGRCVIRLMSGQVTLPNITEEQELGSERVAAGWRLACQTEILGEVRVHIPPDSLVTAQRTQTEGQILPIAIDPAVHTVNVDLTPPTLDDLRSDAKRLRDALDSSSLALPAPVLRRFSNDLRALNFHAKVFINGLSVVGVRPVLSRALGLAVDIGTTKLAAYLVDLSSGETLASIGAMNPQIAFGEDVMSRIGHAIFHQGGAEQLRSAIVEALNELARDLCTQTNCQPEDIVDTVVVGNTAMHHLFLGLPVKQLGQAPFVAAESAALDLPVQDLGLEIAPGAFVHLLPNIAGFVGSDHVAMLLASGLPERKGVVLGMDIGTNTEISLVAQGQHLACSTASGPAFEGAHIQYGMRAAPGAIEGVVFQGEQVFIKTVEDMPAVGLCGSGILDLVAQMRRAGIINSRGAMNLASGNPRLRRGAHGSEFVVVTTTENDGTEITFSRSDINEIQLAKGAIRAGINILLKHAGVNEGDIDEVIIAGAFGTYLNVQSGIDIGMFPRVDRLRYKQVGNAAGVGARMALLSMAQRERAKELARHVEYVELTAEEGFASKFARAIPFE
jgi:uncharacterized 2Fe-2S/4Fe-4S cluster protein (DUF4445 family)